MNEADGDTPWDLGTAPAMTPALFEEQVRAWLEEWAKREGLNYTITHQGVATGAGGDYDIDVLLEVSLLGGARLVLLVECKHQRRRVERKEIIVLEGKLRDVGAHKGMLFTTAGFQKGALEYASAHGIATITLKDGRSLYETRALGETPAPPSWIHFEPVIGVRMRVLEDGSVLCHTMERGRVDALTEWFADEVRAGTAKTPARGMGRK